MSDRYRLELEGVRDKPFNRHTVKLRGGRNTRGTACCYFRGKQLPQFSL
jgi:hypothetical protein